MISLSSPLARFFVALCVGLAVLCTLTRPVVTTLQEVHESAHAVGQAGGDGVDDESVLEGLFHAPHCCVHAFVLPPTLMPAPILVSQAPPRFEPTALRTLPPSRFLRPPISA